jgi:hypothetical protein
MSLAEELFYQPVPVDDVREQLREYDEKVEHALELADSIFVVDKQSAEEAMNFASEARKLQKRLESKRLEITGPSRTFTSEVNALAKSYTARLEEVVDIIQHKIILWKEDTRIKHLDCASIYCEELSMSFDVDTAPDLTTIQSSGCTAYERGVWKYEVMDYRSVPIDYLEVNDSSIKLAMRNGVRNIPGLRIYRETKTSLRSK